MSDIVILEWFNKCEQFIQSHQSQHQWSEDHSLYIMWQGIASSIYLNLIFIEKFIVILPKLSNTTKRNICREIRMNSALTHGHGISIP